MLPIDAGVYDGGPGRDGGLDAGVLDAGVDGGPDAGAYVVIADGGFYVGGQPIFPFGGDLQYFRVHAPDFDAGATYAMWDQTLDLMADAGMNLVTTYVPWDYHNPASGVWDFSGAKDLGHFLGQVCGRGFHVVLKPGPLITAEWPDGWGTYGAVPLWWKEAHPEALIAQSNGDLWTYSPTGDSAQRQPTYLHPAYLAAVQDYYQHVLPIAAPYLGGCLLGIQLDNETNLYWGNHFGSVDYSATAIAFYRQWLAQKYASPAALNALYGTSYTSFASVVAPAAAPTSFADNPAAADWYWAGEAYVGAYLAQLESFLGDAGFGPDRLLHLTNDSPFAATYGTIQIQNVLLHDPATKERFGLPALDLYPKQDPTSGALQDQPFQADYFTSFWEQHHAPGQPAAAFAYAAELQGGFFSYPLIGSPTVQPAATDQLLARTVGHGLRGGAFYVIRGGTNADGSDYDYQAAIGEDGSTRPRYQVMQAWGTFLQQYGLDLQRAHEARNAVAILDDPIYAAPQGNLDDNLQLLKSSEQPALFGWLLNAGIDPAILDSHTVSAAELQTYSVVFFQNPDFVDDQTSQLLAGYVKAGGLLVNLLWAGEYDQNFHSSAAAQTLSTQIFPAQPAGSYVWATNPARTGSFNATFGDGGIVDSELTSCWYESYWSDSLGQLQPFAWERTEPLGTDGRILGYVADDALGTRIFLGTNVYSLYNRENYYSLDPQSLSANAQLAQWLVGFAGEEPIVAIGPRELVWARLSPTRIYLFVVDDSGRGGPQTIQILQPTKLGLVQGTTYAVAELLSGTDLGSATGQSLAQTGVQVSLGAYGTAVVSLTAQ